jgi:hypothetical protein
MDASFLHCAVRRLATCDYARLGIPAESRLLFICVFAGPSSILWFNFDYAAKVKYLIDN